MDLLKRITTDQKSWSGFSQRNAPIHFIFWLLTQKSLKNLFFTLYNFFQKIMICLSQSICFIYHSSGEEAPKTQCYCSGSVKHMHASCLLTWFKEKVKKTCELCHKSDIKKKGKPYMLRQLLFLSPFLLSCIGTVDLHFTKVNIFVFIVTFAIPLPPGPLFPPPPSLWTFCPSLLPCFCWEIEQNKGVW